MKLLRCIFFIFLTLFWGVSVGAQSLPEKGVGDWHTLPFADVRLLSCTTGTLDRNLVVGGLQIKVHSGWVLKKPKLKPLSKHAVLDYPIRPDPVDTTQYTGTILLPIVYNAKAKEEIQFGVQGDLEGCWDDNCLNLPIRMAIPLDNTESDYTSYCAYIMDEMVQTPKLDWQVGKGYYVNDHTAVLMFQVRGIEQAFLQNQNGFHFKVLQTQFMPDRVQFEISYPEKWSKDTIQDWILITNQGVFRAPILLTDQPFPPISHSRPWGSFMLMGILLFVCSPFFILWGTAFPKTAKQLRLQCVQAMVVNALLLTIMCFVMKYLPDLSFEKWGLYILIVMAGTLIFPPKFVWWAAVLFVIWPKPYLSKVLADFALYYLLPWLLIWQLLPFGILYRYAAFWGKKARASLKKDFFYHNLFFLLPTIIMLIYGIYSFRLDIPYQNLSQINLKQPTIICEKHDCVSWMDMKGLHFVDANSFGGQALLDFYQAKENLIIFDDMGTQTILTDTTPNDLEKYLIGLKNYRAGYRPVRPPVRSEGDPRALSPNAK